MQGTGEIKGEDVQHLPKYVQLLSKKVFEKGSKPLGLPPASQKVSIAKCTLNKTNVSLLASVIKTVKEIDSFMANKLKRKFKEHKISVEGVKRFKAEIGKLGNPRISHQREPTSYQLQGIHQGWTDVISACSVYQQSLDMHHGSVTVASSGVGGAQLHTTTTKSYNIESLECLVCIGTREHHSILDNHDNMGITIFLGDQHNPAIVTMESSSYVVVMRNSNTTLSEQHEYFMLPALKNNTDFHSKDRNGFTKLLQHALHEGL